MMVDEMGPVTEPLRADDELLSANPSPPLAGAGTEHAGESLLTRSRSDSDVEMAASVLTHNPAQEELAESPIHSEQTHEAGPQDRPPSMDRVSIGSAQSPSPNDVNGGHQKPKEPGSIISAEDEKELNKDDNKLAVLEDYTEDNNEELSPPPDSPVADTASRASSVPPAALHDEIVVGTKAHKSPRAQAAAPEDVLMGEAEDKPMINQHPKRKRASGIYAESVGDKDDSPAPTEDLDTRRPARPAKVHGTGGVKGVVLGFWRDSPARNDADKHAVIGFIDVRDRLRTRLQPTTRDGRPMDPRYPIPPGPGGSWVTFDKVAFDAHLVGLNHHVVKEYVKIRAEDARQDETPEEAAKRGPEAAKVASARIRANPPPEAATAPLVAYGPELPANAVVPNRPETKKRRLASSFGVPSDSPSVPTPTLLDNIPGTRPTRVLLGYWKHSSEEDPINKHAVFGILGANDMFRVKLTRETRDGRTVIGNFPSGAGALWIHWDEVVFDPHLKHLSRAEVKEYCRVRQRQLDLGELPEERVANETKAVYEAQQRVAQSIALGIPFRKDDIDLPPIAMRVSPMANGSGREAASPGSPFIAPRPVEDSRHPRHTDGLPRINANGRRSLPDVEFRTANRQPAGPNPSALERTNSIANRAIARLEAAQARADMRAASREASLGPAAAAAAATAAAAGLSSSGHSHNPATPIALINSGANTPDTSRFQDNVSRLNKVWEAQEANRIRAGVEDAKIYMGVKYQRKQSGPFQGKLVSQGMIITIDGEDYVEYRVLTKPTFF